MSKSVFRISTRLLSVVGSIFFVAALAVILLVNQQMRQLALQDAGDKARILLDRNLATHTYFAHDLKPGLFAFTEPFRDPATFQPSWMSSTYAVRKMQGYFNALHEQQYYYKECAINARTPENEADPEERAFLEDLTADSRLTARTNVRNIGGKPFLTVLRRGESMEESCLRCHSTPEQAPADLVKLYGPERSFHRTAGQQVSAISIRIPLAKAYASANRFSLRLSLLLLGVLALLFTSLLLASRRLVFTPLARVRDKAREIAAVKDHLGEEIAMPPGLELAQLTEAFNIMSVQLLANQHSLEERVQKRTAALQAALDKVKTLSGFLPICASCKKIRDDKGYWNQIESYISAHSDAEFSHGICPDCCARLYPDLLPEAEGNDPTGVDPTRP